MLKIASVVVDSTIKTLDREFDYIIPEEFSGFIKRGMRVVVPFGKGNKNIEGYVLCIKDSTQDNRGELKNIADIIEDDVFLDERTIKLAYFLKQRYNCTLSEAIKTIMPPGINTKEKLIIKLVSRERCGNKKYMKIIEILKSHGSIEYKKLSSMIDSKLTRALLFEMKYKGIVEVEKEMKQRINVKKYEIYVPADYDKCNEFVLNPPPRIRRQAEILKFILENEDELTLKEIIQKYHCSSSVIKSLEKNGYLIKKEKEVYRNPTAKNYRFDRVELTEDQKDAIKRILDGYKNGRNISLIYGVTGCGKTEIYLNLVERFINEGSDAVVLVPEISLTPQTVERFKGRFGDIVAVLHSRLSDGERYDEWRKIKKGEVKVVVGARSAIFAPLKNLKLIVIDEEHEYSYKSESSPRYLTREVAEYIVNQNGGLLVLGSATPSLESYFKAKTGVYNLVQIMNRIDNKRLPEVKIVDMRDELRNGNKSMFSRELYDSVRQNLDSGHQTILFLNRRGYSTFISCRACGYVSKCNNCDVPLTYHISKNRLICHYCGFEYEIPAVCPECGSKYIKYFGAGTEKIENDIKRCFPSARVLRMDVDTTRNKGEHERIYIDFKESRADILIGTQMITKGMDFKNVTLVGVIAADTTLNIPDFRAAERTFQLLTQVSGRAGRGEEPGRVIIQTYAPEHYSIVFASKHDYTGFYNKEIQIRKILNNPPFTDILYVLLTSENESELAKFALSLREVLHEIIKGQNISLLGPTPCHIYKIKNNYRWHIILKGDVIDIYKTLDHEIFKKTSNSCINYSLDINPYNMI